MTLSFFRRHRKLFMVVMFAALVGMLFFGSWSYMGPAFQHWFGGGPGSNVVGTIGGKNIKEREAAEFLDEISMAGRATRLWLEMLEPKATTPDTQARLSRCTIETTALPYLPREFFSEERVTAKLVVDWLAVYREARKAGFDTSDHQVQERLSALADLGLPKGAVDQLVSHFAGGNRDRFYQALRRDMTLASYLGWMNQSFSEPVTPELRREFAKMDDRVQVRVAALKADDFLADVKDIPEADLKAQFEKYKSFLPGQGPEGYGYRIPDRVKVEYLLADPKGFEAEEAAKITDEDVRKYYEARKDPDFLVKEEKPPEAAPPAAPAPAKAPAAPAPAEKAPAGPKGEAGPKGPVAPKAAATPVTPPPSIAPIGIGEMPPVAMPPEKKFKPLAEVQAEIRGRILKERTKAAALELLGADVGEIRQQKKTPDLRIWADGKKVKYVPATAAFCTEAQLAALPGIGHAQRGKETFEATALAVSDLVGAEKAKLALMETAEPFVDPDGVAYAFRVAAVQTNHESPSIDEVKGQVMTDLKKAKAFEIAREKGKSLLEAAEKRDLKDAAADMKFKTADSDWVPQQRFFQLGQQILSMPATLPGVGANRVVMSECFRLASEKKRLALVTLADEKAVVVIELLGHKPPREALFDLLRPALAQQGGRMLLGESLRQALDPANIERRTDVVMKVPDDYHLSRNLRDIQSSSSGDDY
ncbi:MAG: hypothetical protein NT049_12430 [Planctomycetota bacterium]|nr:hypothetical protein [Planctomycetota bacterium]